MSRNAEILNELQALNSSLAGMAPQMPYALPEGYFATLADALMGGTLAVEGPDATLPGLPKALPFEIPDGYFAHLSEELAQNALIDDAKVPATPYKVPDGYFDSLPATLLEAVKCAETPQRHTKTIVFRPQWSRVVRLAAAAVLVFGLGVGTYRFVHPASPEKIAAQQLSKLDGAAIDAYVEQHVDDFDVESLEATVAASGTDAPATISNVEAEEINDYLQESGETM